MSVTGTGSKLDLGSNPIKVGWMSLGTLDIESGGEVKSAGAYIGYNSHANNAVAVSNGTWNNTGSLRVGGGDPSEYAGSGTLTIFDGGTVNTGETVLGGLADSFGTVVVSGVNSTLDVGTQSIYVGKRGQGTLGIYNQGSLRSGTAYIGYEWPANNVVTVDNATWNSSGAVCVGGGGGAGTGALTIQNGGTLQCADVYVGYLGTGEMTVQGGGTVLAAGAVLAWAPGAR